MRLVTHKSKKAPTQPAAAPVKAAKAEEGEGKGKKEDVKKGNGHGNGNGAAKEAKEEGDKKPSGNDESDWTAEQDAKLLELKTANPQMAWVEVSKEVGRPVDECKNRLREIKKSGNKPEGGQPQHDKGGHDNKQEQVKNGNQDHGKNNGRQGNKHDNHGKKDSDHGKKDEHHGKNEDHGKGKAKQHQHDAVKRGDGHAGKKTKVHKELSSKSSSTSSDTSSSFSDAKYKWLYEDANFSPDELKLIGSLLYKDKKQSWLRLASGFYNVTGRRVHPDDLREKFSR